MSKKIIKINIKIERTDKKPPLALGDKFGEFFDYAICVVANTVF